MERNIATRMPPSIDPVIKNTCKNNSATPSFQYYCAMLFNNHGVLTYTLSLCAQIVFKTSKLLKISPYCYTVLARPSDLFISFKLFKDITRQLSRRSDCKLHSKQFRASVIAFCRHPPRVTLIADHSTDCKQHPANRLKY